MFLPKKRSRSKELFHDELGCFKVLVAIYTQNVDAFIQFGDGK